MQQAKTKIKMLGKKTSSENILLKQYTSFKALVLFNRGKSTDGYALAHT